MRFVLKLEDLTLFGLRVQFYRRKIKISFRGSIFRELEKITLFEIFFVLVENLLILEVFLWWFVLATQIWTPFAEL